jgi:excisionase family DNA binding protein
MRFLARFGPHAHHTSELARRALRRQSMKAEILPMFLTVQDVAEMLQVDERTILRWAQHDASMPTIRLGRVIRFEREPLLRWLARKHPRVARAFAQTPPSGST